MREQFNYAATTLHIAHSLLKYMILNHLESLQKDWYLHVSFLFCT